jgi:hypothetical protein
MITVSLPNGGSIVWLDAEDWIVSPPDLQEAVDRVLAAPAYVRRSQETFTDTAAEIAEVRELIQPGTEEHARAALATLPGAVVNV